MAKVLMKGNEAMAEAAIQAGCQAFFGYPITPQSEIPEYFARELPKRGGLFLQAESELAAMNMVMGASASGARVMTSTSGPGYCLKLETLAAMTLTRPSDWVLPGRCWINRIGSAGKSGSSSSLPRKNSPVVQ